MQLPPPGAWASLPPRRSSGPGTEPRPGAKLGQLPGINPLGFFTAYTVDDRFRCAQAGERPTRPDARSVPPRGSSAPGAPPTARQAQLPRQPFSRGNGFAVATRGEPRGRRGQSAPDQGQAAGRWVIFSFHSRVRQRRPPRRRRRRRRRWRTSCRFAPRRRRRHVVAGHGPHLTLSDLSRPANSLQPGLHLPERHRRVFPPGPISVRPAL